MCVKKRLKILAVCEKNEKKSDNLRGDFFDSHCSSGGEMWLVGELANDIPWYSRRTDV